ncbi:hypothetical protein BV898_06562 [Hypsibius exemplaris]|uniref:SURP motif domain-containing protein n=1 Tax=Hypsibius exemplaris TaxID=2072580 RepID=A0A1W0WVU6_HYPEX|nr:hypothetical protein BV898_06562 [Hypsibius exemplaris]
MDGGAVPPGDTELRKIIETLAQYVAKNGTHFEDMVKNREMNNPQFFFLRGGDFNKYYEQCVAAERQRLGPQAAPLSNQQQQQQQQPNGAQGAGAPQVQGAPLQSAVQRAAAIAAALVQQQQQQIQQQQQQQIQQQQQQMQQFQAPSMSGSYPQQQNSFGQFGNDTPDSQNYSRQPFSYGGPPPGQPMMPPPPRFAPPGWQQPPPNPNGDYSQPPPHQQGFPPPGFAQGPPPPRLMFGHGMPPPGFPPGSNPRFGPPPSYQAGIPPPGMGFHPNFGGPPPGMPPQQHFQPPPMYADQQAPPKSEPPPPVEARPWYDLPAGLMLSLIRTEDTEYKSIDTKDLIIPPPQPITDKIMRAMDEFYSQPNNSQPRNAEGWEKLV